MADFDGNPAYTLWWPLDLFAREIEDIYLRCADSGISQELGSELTLLLRQAFTTEVPANEFGRIQRDQEAPNEDADPRWSWLGELVDATRNQALGPKPYFSQRHQKPRSEIEFSLPLVVNEIRSLARTLYNTDYFGKVLGVDCGAWYAEARIPPDSELDRLVGKPHLWDANPSTWGGRRPL